VLYPAGRRSGELQPRIKLLVRRYPDLSPLPFYL